MPGRQPLPQSRCFHPSVDHITDTLRWISTTQMAERRKKAKGKESASGDSPQTPPLSEEEEEHEYGTPEQATTAFARRNPLLVRRPPPLPLPLRDLRRAPLPLCLEQQPKPLTLCLE